LEELARDADGANQAFSLGCVFRARMKPQNLNLGQEDTMKPRVD
jgi:hypothetical protein